MRFLLMGDRHNSERKPQSRTDDYFETVKNKDAEILQIAKDYNVAAIIQAGDFWTDGDAKIKNDFIPSVLKRWTNPFNVDEFIPMIGIAGNHDLIGGNLKSLQNTTLGLTSALGYMRLVTKDDPVIFTLDNGKTVAITGTHYHIGMDKAENIDDYIIDNKLGDYHIHIVHGMLSPKNLGKIIRHTNIDDIKHTKADVTFCGHDHIGFDTICHEGKYFLNPGAVVRLKNDVKELTRQVKVVLLEINDSGITLTDIPLKTALESKYVLDREVIEQKKAKTIATENMKAQIKKLEISQDVKFSGILEGVLEREKAAKEIVDDLNKRISEKEVENNNHLKAPTNVWIKEIKLSNFQSHEDTVIDFSNRFNVLLGESRQGKTSILRALRWVLENKPTGKSMIRHGTTNASVTIKLANDTIITRFIGAKENGYRVVMPDGTVQEGNTKMVGLVQSLCGFNDMDVDKKLSLPINFLRQGSGWYLIDDNMSSTDRARVLGSLQNTQAADAVVKDLDKENTQISATIKHNNVQIATTVEEVDVLVKEKEKLEKIQYLLQRIALKEEIEKYLELKKQHDYYEGLSKKLSQICDEITSKNLASKIKSQNETKHIILEECEKIIQNSKIIKLSTERISVCDRFISESIKLKKIQALMDKRNILFDNVKVVNTETKRQRQINGMFDRLSGYKEHLIRDIQKLIDKKSDIINSYKEINRYTRSIQAADKFIKASDATALSAGNIKKIQDLTLKKAEIQKSLNDAALHKKSVDTQSKKIEQLNESELNYKNEKRKILLEAKVCPICSQLISDDILGGHNHGER